MSNLYLTAYTAVINLIYGSVNERKSYIFICSKTIRLNSNIRPYLYGYEWNAMIVLFRLTENDLLYT